MSEIEGTCGIRGCAKDAVDTVTIKGEDRTVCAAHYGRYTGQVWQPKPKAEDPSEPPSFSSVDVKSHDTPGQVLELTLKIREADEQLDGWKAKKKALQDELWRIVDQERDKDEDQTSIQDFAGDAEEAQEEPDEDKEDEKNGG